MTIAACASDCSDDSGGGGDFAHPIIVPITHVHITRCVHRDSNWVIERRRRRSHVVAAVSASIAGNCCDDEFGARTQTWVRTIKKRKYRMSE